MVTDPAPTETGHVLVADVLGFSRMVLCLPEDQVHERIRQWVDLVKTGAERFSITRFQLFSDTVIAVTSDTSEGLTQLTKYARYLLEAGIGKGFMVRGGMAVGQFNWGELIYGPAVIRAFDLEKTHRWIGIACQLSIPRDDAILGVHGLVAYVSPSKSDPVNPRPVVAWSVPDGRALKAAMLAASPGKAPDWEEVDKVNNTLLFRTYLSLVEYGAIAPSTGLGPLPAQAFAEAVRIAIKQGVKVKAAP